MESQQKPGRKMLLGEILLERGLVTKEQLDQALRVQVGGMRRLGSILVGMRILGVENLTDALSAQLKLPVVTVEDEFRADVKGVLPRYLCRKYSVLPLSRESNNVLRLAMADPLDGVAVSDVEHYTGLVVQPVLARLSDIERAIPAHVAFSGHDLFNPQVYRSVARSAVAAILVLLAVTGVMGYQKVQVWLHGTEETRADGSVVFRHQDLMVDAAKDGSVYFSGRGDHANSYYGVRFDNLSLLNSFVQGSAGQFSNEQIAWMDWVLRKKLKSPGPPLTAKNN